MDLEKSWGNQLGHRDQRLLEELKKGHIKGHSPSYDRVYFLGYPFGQISG